MGDAVLLGAFYAILAALALFGAQRWLMVRLYLRHRGTPHAPPPAPLGAAVPLVTVQLPLYNERFVAARVIDAVAAFDWPRDRLEVQVLDDSTDDTTAIVRERVAHWRARGLEIALVRREGREGFKAGALAHGLSLAKGELIAIFDADFVPPPDFLRKTAPFFAEARTALAQTRWSHRNRGESLLTELAGIALDAHLAVEQPARSRSGRFFNFNGTAGLWRRAAIDDAGGWHADTLTEDLDLSFRAQLRGWRFVYLDAVETPAELPSDMEALRAQQHRWTKGGAQTARKLLGAVVRAEIPWWVKLEAATQLTMNAVYPLVVLLTALLPFVLGVRFERPWLAWALVDAPGFLAATASSIAFLGLSQRALFPGRLAARLPYIPLVLGFGVGLALSHTRAFVEGLLTPAGRSGEFIRTPKRGDAEPLAGERAGYRVAVPWRTLLPLLELAMGAVYALVAVRAAREGRWLAVPFAALFAWGCGYIATLSIAMRVRRPARAPLPVTAPPERVPTPEVATTSERSLVGG